MAQCDVQMQIADTVLKVNVKHHVKPCAFSRRRVSLDIHAQLQWGNWVLGLW